MYHSNKQKKGFNMYDKLKERYENFSDQIAKLKLSYRISSRTFKYFLNELSEKQANFDKLDLNLTEKGTLTTNIENYYFINPYTGGNELHGNNKFNYKEYAEQCYIHRNKQYQWLLVDGYEFFEEYIIDLYIIFCHDLGINCLRLNEDKEGMRDKKKLKKYVNKIIVKFRDEARNIKYDEGNNKTGRNLFFYIKMIEQFRHIIVHKNGKVSDLDIIVKNILNNSCITGNKKLEPEYREIIQRYIYQGTEKRELSGVIVLEDYKINEIMSCSKFEALINDLLGYALILSCNLLALKNNT